MKLTPTPTLRIPMNRPLALGTAVLMAVGLASTTARAQQAQPPQPQPPLEPFRGVTGTGTVEPGLFPLRR
ncbi:MAG: hypothetical protein EB136_06335 [Synechococcaceae bacterium WBB_3_034]|nr:hypothetical protein [Synechococcaceae bacterium WBB_3_034]